MSMFKIFNVSGSAVSAQSQRLNVVASNLANADTVAGPDKSPYKARQVVFNTTPMGDVGTAGVTVSQVTEDNTPGRRVLDPKHPQARCRRLCDLQQRQHRGRDGQHDLGISVLPKQHRGHEHDQEPADEDPANGSRQLIHLIPSDRKVKAST